MFHWVKPAWDDVIDACAGARRSIDFEQYIVGDDGIGRRLLGVFRDRARAGVRVRMLCDAAGSRALLNASCARELQAAGGELRFYGLSRFGAFRLPFGIVRDHRKLVIVDGELAYTGGLCFTDRMSSWRDTLLRLRGPVVEAIETGFSEQWRGVLGGQRVPPQSSGSVAPRGELQYLLSTPRSRRHFQCLMDRVGKARERIRLCSPYLVPDHLLLRALTQASARGVRVELVLPARSDHRSLDLIARCYARYLKSHGCAIHWYSAAVMHAKLVSVDREWAMVSSMNLDRQSLHRNLENGVSSEAIAFVAAVDSAFEQDIARSDRA